MSGIPTRWDIYAATLGSTARKLIASGDAKAEFVAPDKVLFMKNGSLFVQRVDSDLNRAGEPALVERRIGFAPVIHCGAFSVSQADALAFAPWVNPDRRLTYLDRRGNIVGVLGDPGDWGTTHLSVAAGKAILTRADPETNNIDLWSVDVERGVASRLTSSERDENHGVFSPDGKLLAFDSFEGGLEDLYLLHLDTGRTERLTKERNRARPWSWSPDGKSLVYMTVGKNGGDLWLYPIDPRGPERPLATTKFYETEAAVSPDGRWLAYTSTDDGHDDIYVQPFPNGGERYQVSADGGSRPNWSDDGRELFFINLKNEMCSARVTQSDSKFQTAPILVLFHLPGLIAPQPLFSTAYQVMPDGRFLMTVTPESGPSKSIHVALNWQ
jgi:serine/threonine-protein kinase